MKSTGIFLIILLLITHYAGTKSAFQNVHNLLLNFKKSNVNEQEDADIREHKERKWCVNNIGKQSSVVSRRQKDVDNLKAHIKFLKKEKKEHIKDRDSRVKRIKANDALLDKFKKQRCDNNLLFVKNLEEHMQALDVLNLLRKDILLYFQGQREKALKKAEAARKAEEAKKEEARKKAEAEKKAEEEATKKKEELLNNNPPTLSGAPSSTSDFNKILSGSQKDEINLVESRSRNLIHHKAAVGLMKSISKLSDYDYLLDSAHKSILTQLFKFSDKVSKQTGIVNNFSKTKERSEKEIGTGHIDNTKDALKKLETPSFESSASFDAKTEKKVLKMIDSLINHLKKSRDQMTRDEIKGSEDFGKFQKNLKLEQSHLRRTVKEHNKKITKLTNEINVSNAQLIKRKSLRDLARIKLDALKKLCRRKYKYFADETKRRIKENKMIDYAITLFKQVMLRQKTRAALRTNNKVSGKEFGHDLEGRIANAESGVKKSSSDRIKGRFNIAFIQRK